MKRIRAGSLMVETLAAMTLITVALVGVSQLLVAAGRHQRMLESRRIAALTAANLMEQAMSLPYEQLVQERLDAFTVDERVSQRLKNVQGTFQISETADAPTARQIELELSWDNPAGDRQIERLVAWKYPKETQP